MLESQRDPEMDELRQHVTDEVTAQIFFRTLFLHEPVDTRWIEDRVDHWLARSHDRGGSKPHHDDLPD